VKLTTLKTKCALTLVIAGLLGAGPVLADKPEWAGKGKGKSAPSDRRHDDGKSRRNNDRHSENRRSHFEDRHRVIARDYYVQQFQGGRRCPPGLAKKNNGCMPPGQAKKWKIGRPLPREVIYYEVPRPLVVQIGPPPSGHRYVRVAGDILMIAIGTGMVVDALENLLG
jgi:Ni/Co efflux regulator RcnB